MQRLPLSPAAVAAIVLVPMIVWGADRADAARPNVQPAGPTSVMIDAIRPFEEADGYTYVEATMHGAVEREDGSNGAYAVPMVLIYRMMAEMVLALSIG